MKNDISTHTKDIFFKIIFSNAPELTENQRQKLLLALTEASVEICRQSVSGFSQDYTKAVYELESHKKQFSDHIDSMSAYTKRLLKELEDKGVVSYDRHPKTGAKMIKSTSSVVFSMCEFLNSLNELVTLFYRDIYKIHDPKEKIITQQSLF